jgi:hypothetical protein
LQCIYILWIRFLSIVKTVNLYPQSFEKFAFVTAGAHPKRGGLQGATPPNQNLKNTDFVDMMISNCYVIYPSDKISH